MDLYQLCEETAFVEFAAQLPTPFFVIDQNSRVYFNSQSQGHMLSAGAMHHGNCTFCKREDMPCAIKASLSDGQIRHIRLPAYLCGGGSDVVLDIFPHRNVNQEPYLLVFQRDVDPDSQALSSMEPGHLRRERQLHIMNLLLSSLQKSRDFRKNGNNYQKFQAQMEVGPE